MPWIIAGGVAVVVAIAAIVAVAAGGGDDDGDAARDLVETTVDDQAGDDGAAEAPDDSTSDSVEEDAAGPAAPSTSGSPDATAAPGEYQDVVVTGDPLPRLTGDDDDAIGEAAPALSGSSFDGTPIEIDPASGKPTLVVFLAHWCPHCNREVPRLVEWNDEGAVPADLQIIGVSTGARDDAPNWPPSEWIADESWPWPVMADTEDQIAAQAYGLPGYPYFVLIGADGEVKHRQSGEVPISELEDILADAGIQ